MKSSGQGEGRPPLYKVAAQNKQLLAFEAWQGNEKETQDARGFCPRFQATGCWAQEGRGAFFWCQTVLIDSGLMFSAKDLGRDRGSPSKPHCPNQP